MFRYPATLGHDPVQFAFNFESVVYYLVQQDPSFDLIGDLTTDDVNGTPQFSGLMIFFEIDDVSQELAGLSERSFRRLNVFQTAENSTRLRNY